MYFYIIGMKRHSPYVRVCGISQKKAPAIESQWKFFQMFIMPSQCIFTQNWNHIVHQWFSMCSSQTTTGPWNCKVKIIFKIKQWLVKLLVLQHRSRQCPQTVLVVIEFFTATHSTNFCNPVSFLNVFNGVLIYKKIIFLLNLDDWVHIFLKFCVTRSVHKALLLHSLIQWLSRRKMFAQSFELCTALAAFDMEHNFYLKEWLAERLWFFRLEYWADIFLKINEVNLQEKQLTVFATNNKIWAFKQN